MTNEFKSPATPNPVLAGEPKHAAPEGNQAQTSRGGVPGAEQIVHHLRLIQNDERVDFHARGYAEFAANEIERLTAELKAEEETVYACMEKLKECAALTEGRKRKQHELLPFLAMWADRYQRDYGLDGLHPVHYDLMKQYGAPMDRFKRATNAALTTEGRKP